VITIPPQAVILAAGRGTRMRSDHPKVLEPALGVPLLGHVLAAVEVTGADPIAVVVGHKAEEVEAAFADRRVVFRRQEPPRGTGHAVQVARDVFEKHSEQTLLVVSGDAPLLRGQTLLRLLEEHGARRAAATILTVSLDDPGAYGRIVRDEKGNVRRIVEARDASPEERAVREVNAGAYAFHVPSLLPILSDLKPQNAQKEYYLTDVIGLLSQAGHLVGTLTATNPAEALGVNTFEELADMTRRLRERVLLGLMQNGVRIEDPATTQVGLDVVVEHDAVLRPGTILEGKTVVRTGATVGPFVRVVDSEIGPGAHILDHCFLNQCVVEAGASVGPFAHLRPETRVGRQARVGNFVELKKVILGDGAKAPHLTYLGDATVGPAANIGAGTITCNYDGRTKHPTRIESNAFVGSNSTLVAPVTVGEGAYVGAGSVITEDVPARALALGRARQVVKHEWASQREAAAATDERKS
jgi:bifunctional UDP-N-acetylglucosamine pyrophosphorylase/glucosamine-1-phosphate N-acetyltransferase